MPFSVYRVEFWKKRLSSSVTSTNVLKNSEGLGDSQNWDCLPLGCKEKTELLRSRELGRGKQLPTYQAVASFSQIR